MTRVPWVLLVVVGVLGWYVMTLRDARQGEQLQHAHDSLEALTGQLERMDTQRREDSTRAFRTIAALQDSIGWVELVRDSLRVAATVRTVELRATLSRYQLPLLDNLVATYALERRASDSLLTLVTAQRDTALSLYGAERLASTNWRQATVSWKTQAEKWRKYRPRASLGCTAGYGTGGLAVTCGATVRVWGG